MKVFVTGPTGNIGTHLTQFLKDLDVAFTAGCRSIVDQTFPATLIDFEDAKGLAKAFRGHEVLFLLTPDSDQSKQWVSNTIQAAQEVGIQHIVRSSGIRANLDSDYFVFKELGEMEQLVKDSGIKYTMIQPNSFFQNFVTFQNQNIRNGTVFLPHAQAMISYVDVRDVAWATACILKDVAKHINKAYVITGPKAISDQELLNEIGRAIEKTVDYLPVSDEDTTTTFRQYHLPEYNIKQLISLYQADRAGETSIVSGDFEAITGRKPRGARDFAKDYKQHWMD